MKRATALIVLRSAGYHADSAAFVRTYIENRISRARANEEYQRGARMKLAGVECVCPACKAAARKE